jgi:brefeldin A-inhibited guanine nucleotide-exchange protein
MIGEYLGEAEEDNVLVMHAFVDQMDFTRLKFIDALRQFLQSFRLPGEAQKIDRLMLKFAGRYLHCNPNSFANADTAYILAYSVIMLNTDAHSPQVKNRMTKQDFIKNNRGINDGSDLPEDYLIEIYNEIYSHEIVLKDEQEAALLSANMSAPSAGIAAGIGNVLATVGRDMQREAYMAASEGMAAKTEMLLKNLVRAQRRVKSTNSVFYSASHFQHVGPMFSVAWMPILAAFSGPMQSSDDFEIISLCLEGFKLSIRLVCLFDLELARNAFVTTLAKFTLLGNLSEMKTKHVEAVKVLLEIALSEGNQLKSSWKDILTCVSQLERFQLISSGVDATAVPDVSQARVQNRESFDGSRASVQTSRRSQQGQRSVSTRGTLSFAQDVADESRSKEVVHAVDRIFTNSALLSGEAIVDFVKALSEVSWEEIQSAGKSAQPRMFSLQKLVEISYYNMNRIRMEWSNIWVVLGEHFNQVWYYKDVDLIVGWMSFQYQYCFLRSRFPPATLDAFPRNRRATSLPISKGFSETIRTCYSKYIERHCERYDFAMLESND